MQPGVAERNRTALISNRRRASCVATSADEDEHAEADLSGDAGPTPPIAKARPAAG